MLAWLHAAACGQHQVQHVARHGLPHIKELASCRICLQLLTELHCLVLKQFRKLQQVVWAGESGQLLMSLWPVLRLAHEHTFAQPVAHQLMARVQVRLTVQQLLRQLPVSDWYEKSVKNPTTTECSILGQVVGAALKEIC